MTVETADFITHLDFIVPTVANVREAIKDGATRIDGMPAAEILAKLEAGKRVPSQGEPLC